MTRFIAFAFVCTLAVACKPSEPVAAAGHGTPPDATAAVAATAPCEHGVQKDICARCNPALKPAFVAKKDWCGEHERPESQCVICHPELAAKGIK